jgi:mRNA interferase RelE/StbE
MHEVQIERTAERDLRRLDEQTHDRIVKQIVALGKEPRPTGSKKLSGSKNDWRIRVGDYRVLYEIADAIRVVRVYRVRHRRDVYK